MDVWHQSGRVEDSRDWYQTLEFLTGLDSGGLCSTVTAYPHPDPLQHAGDGATGKGGSRIPGLVNFRAAEFRIAFWAATARGLGCAKESRGWSAFADHDGISTNCRIAPGVGFIKSRPAPQPLSGSRVQGGAGPPGRRYSIHTFRKAHP